MKTKDAIKYFGGAFQLAEALGIRRQAVYMWDESPPLGRQYQIQVLTNGKLKAERRAA